MGKVAIFSGTFCPPTFGHLEVVREACKTFTELIILCSVNPNKNGNWFTQQECKNLWYSYPLPSNANVMTFNELVKTKPKTQDIILVRGVRNSDDLLEEQKVMELNFHDFGIKDFYYICTDKHFSEISSSKVRQMTENLQIQDLHRYSKLLEKVLDLQNIFMVCGQPGSGKSTFCQHLVELDNDNQYINTDLFNKQLAYLLELNFPGQDLLELALNNEEELLKVLKEPWMELLRSSLLKAKGAKNLFVEIPFGLQEHKQMFRFVGGKVIYLYCQNKQENKKRLKNRKTPEHLTFIERIPNLTETKKLAQKHLLQLTCIDSGNSVEELKQKAQDFLKELE